MTYAIYRSKVVLPKIKMVHECYRKTFSLIAVDLYTVVGELKTKNKLKWKKEQNIMPYTRGRADPAWV